MPQAGGTYHEASAQNPSRARKNMSCHPGEGTGAVMSAFVAHPDIGTCPSVGVSLFGTHLMSTTIVVLLFTPLTKNTFNS